ncbi:MAG: hypothetical protein D8M57_03530 [Candidatus Scalindua sp. AMX11]|nr:MAG: hypothetical protein DWQ00_11165 [Candidatus Scalindua sp.]NOG82764.1 hypothetical protein [Planctomycetota bacterium]RZV95332.1 MAG: hypothetical protein EX341_03100 [Candidatus Scalindua sp. SCAELEC01]TDE66186.1 MAG: hypothetical protein D8M57_03530 [Candidatus Scalindua sp. AMX11]GJQ57803.1 MAG: hypothetical protein SCALA701_06040 [Candidatus Scalindua sp.]
MKIFLIVLFVLGIGISCLTGCQTNDNTRTKAEGTAVGVGGGALLGGLLGAAFGGGEGAIIGAAAGALAGGAAGYAYGAHVAKEKEKYAKAEDWLDACIISLNEKNRETLEFNLELDKNIVDLDATTARLVNDYNNKRVKKAALKSEKERVDAKRVEAELQLAEANYELENQQKVLDETMREVGHNEYTKALDWEISELKAHMKELKLQTDKLASLSSRMSV